MSKHIHIHVGARKKAKDADEYTGRNTGPDKWNVFKKGSSVAVAGPFKTAAEASAWIKNATKDAYRGPWTEEVEPDEFKSLTVGKTINRKGVKARVVSKHINNAKKTENGTLIPQKFMVGFETVDGAKDSNTYKVILEPFTGGKFRPKILKNGVTTVWVSPKTFPSESEAKAEGERQIKNATKDVDPKAFSATGQSFLPKVSTELKSGSYVKTGSGFTAKNSKGFKAFFKPNEEEKARAWAKDSGPDKLSPSLEKQIGTEGSSHREGMPANVFLEPAERKYPVKEQENGEWKWSKKLLIAAAREARMHGDELLAKRADEIRAREFGADI